MASRKQASSPPVSTAPITFAVLIANLLVDILYVRLDPRVRY